MKIAVKQMAILTTVILFSTLLVGMKRPIFKSVGMNHFVNLMFKPSDLFSPIVEVDCFLWKEGYSAIYPLKPKYRDFYMIGLMCSETNIPTALKFDGELLVEFLKGGQVVKSQTVSSFGPSILASKDMELCKEISLMEFEMPLDGKYWDDVSLRVTVLKPAEMLKKYERGLKLYVAVTFRD